MRRSQEPDAPEPARCAPRRDALAAAALGLVLRVALVAWAAPRFAPAADGRFYHAIAERIAGGHGYTWLWPDGAVTHAAHYPIGYPALLGIAYRLAGAAPMIAMLANALLGSLAVVAVHRLAARSASRKGALLAALLVALHPALIGYTPALMTEGVSAALLALLAWAATALAPLGGVRRRAALLGTGMLAGFVVLVRPQHALLLPVLGALAVTSGAAANASRQAGRMLLATLLLAAGATLVVAPWTLRNCLRMDRCVVVSANAGWNLLIGAQGDGGFGAIEGDRVPAECRSVVAEAQKDRCFFEAALTRIAAAPGRWLLQIPRKLALTFDYGGAPGWYLHASNPDAFGTRAKLALGVAETLWQRGIVLAALLALGGRDAPARSARRWLAGAGALALVTPAAWLAHLALVAQGLLTGRRALADPPLVAAAGAVAATGLAHAVFFGAGRYALPCAALLAALAGTLLGPVGAVTPTLTAPAGARDTRGRGATRCR